VPKDLPGRDDRPERSGLRPSVDLVGRLDRLPAGHPSSRAFPGGAEGHGSERLGDARQDGQFDDQRLGADTRQQPDAGDGTAAESKPDRQDRLLAAADRREWQELLASGEVDRVGRGVVDERASRFQPRERTLADLLAGEGHAVVAIHDGYGRQGRKPDAAVDGILTEFKSLDPGATSTTVKAALTSAKGQAPHAIIDGRGSGLNQQEADRGIRRFLGTPHARGVESARIVGDDYDLEWKRG
jgi:hypothetical protein